MSQRGPSHLRVTSQKDDIGKLDKDEEERREGNKPANNKGKKIESTGTKAATSR